jgi:hypothetical protein
MRALPDRPIAPPRRDLGVRTAGDVLQDSLGVLAQQRWAAGLDADRENFIELATTGTAPARG